MRGKSPRAGAFLAALAGGGGGPLGPPPAEHTRWRRRCSGYGGPNGRERAHRPPSSRSSRGGTQAGGGAGTRPWRGPTSTSAKPSSGSRSYRRSPTTQPSPDRRPRNAGELQQGVDGAVLVREGRGQRRGDRQLPDPGHLVGGRLGHRDEGSGRSVAQAQLRASAGRYPRGRQRMEPAARDIAVAHQLERSAPRGTRDWPASASRPCRGCGPRESCPRGGHRSGFRRPARRHEDAGHDQPGDDAAGQRRSHGGEAADGDQADGQQRQQDRERHRDEAAEPAQPDAGDEHKGDQCA